MHLDNCQRHNRRDNGRRRPIVHDKIAPTFRILPCPPRSTRMRPLVSGLVDDQILIVINDLLTQITAVFVTIGGASDGSGTRTKTTGNYRG